jgi:hypothetical protein
MRWSTPPNPPQQLDVEAHQLARAWPLVADDPSTRLKGGQRVKPDPAQLRGNGRQWDVVILGDVRAAPALPSGFADPAPLGAPQPRRRCARARRPVRRPLRQATLPFVDRCTSDDQRRGHLALRLARLHAGHDLPSRARGQAGIFDYSWGLWWL